ncbi:TadE/TadG family type IV pilus assembly protein [Vibrio sp. E150_011]
MKRTTRLNSLKRQNGVAAIWMGLSLVPIMGFTFWAVEGTRYVQEKSRLGDATEAAAIAVTMVDNQNTAEQLATSYVQAYVRDIKSSQVSAVRKYQEADAASDILEYIQYTVGVTTTHDSWFSSTFIPSFDETQDLTGQSVAKKYPAYLGDNNIDIVFASDFSGSMNRRWGSNSSCTSWSCKITDLKEAVTTISDKLLCSDIQFDRGLNQYVCMDDDQSELADKLLNRIGIVPYNIRTREKNNNGRAFAVSQLRYKTDIDVLDPEKAYEDVNWNKWRQYYSYQIYNCSVDQDYCPNQTSGEHAQTKRIAKALGIYRNSYYYNTYHVDVEKYVDYQATVSEMLENKFPDNKSKYRVDSNLLYSGFGSSSTSQFTTIDLTNSATEVAAVNNMSANGSTASFQGILRGLQILADGNPNSDDEDEQEAYDNKIKMLLILSDGQESPNNGILSGLVNGGLCDDARTLIPGLYIGIIGIDFSSSNVKEFQKCVIDPDEDIIDVSNLDELIEKIEELIRKGSKTSGTTKLY